MSNKQLSLSINNLIKMSDSNLGKIFPTKPIKEIRSVLKQAKLNNKKYWILS